MSLKIATIVTHARKQPADINDRGNAIHRFNASAQRYVIDFADDFKPDGWEQFDTDQDAGYFGVWVNRRQLLTLTYAEGDWSLVVCPDAEHYKAEVQSMIDFYGEGYVAKAIDADWQMTVFKQDRAGFLQV